MLTTPYRVFLINAILLTSITADPVFGSDPIELKYKFHQGESVIYKMAMNQFMVMDFDVMPGKPQQVSMKMKIELYHKTINVHQDAATLEVGFNRYAVETKLGHTKYPTPHSDEIKKLRLSMRITNRGKITESKIVNADELNPQFKQITESIRSSIAHNIVSLPDKPIQPGDSWDVEQQIPTNLPGAANLMMKISATYKLVKLLVVNKEKQAEIDVTMKMLLSDKTDQDQPEPLQANLSGNGKGKCLFSINKGRMIKNRTSFGLDGTTVTSDPWGKKVNTKLNMRVEFKMEAS